MRASAPGESVLLLLDVIDLLAAQGCEYAVVGALAASIHGAVRASMDADVVLASSVLQAQTIKDELEAGGFRVELVRGDPDDPIPALLQVVDAYGNRVDLLVGLRGLDPQAFKRALLVPFKGRSVSFIGCEDFVATKVFAGGPLDLVDATRAIAAAGSSLDRGLARRLAERFGQDAANALDRLLRIADER